MEDIKIIELFFNRDETAIQELSNKYSGYCYKIVWNLLNNHEDVEECLNDTWLAAWEYIPPRRPSVLSAYVGKIARGFAIDCFRKAGCGSAWMGMLLTFVVKWMNVFLCSG